LPARPLGKLTEVGAAWAEGVPTAEEAAQLGLTLADYEDDFVECWPENWPAFQLLASIGRQWRTGGMGGFIALDYNVLFHRMDRMKLADDEYEQLFRDVQVMESAALKVLNRPKDQ
jgi:hypothetical protein